MSRLLWCRDGDHPGAVNMERDRALWQRFEADPAGGVRLRVYGWDPPAVSLGFHQPAESVDAAAVRAGHFDLVRRPTGGAAVLHVDEVTYSVSAPLGTPGLGRGVLEIHGAIAAALEEAFRRMGLMVERGGDGVPREFACFAGAGGHEMTLGGRKLVGSALRRGRSAFLQHGSVLRSERHLELCSLMAGLSRVDRERERSRLAARTCFVPDLDALVFARSFAGALADQCGLGAERVDTFEELLVA